MTSMNDIKSKMSYRDIIEKLQDLPEKIKEEKRVTYEEWIKIFNESKKIKKVYTRESIINNNFIDDHLDQFMNITEILKEKNNFFGFFNNMEYYDIMNMCIKNMHIDEIKESEHEDDDETGIIEFNTEE